jgi:hypothetical protein
MRASHFFKLIFMITVFCLSTTCQKSESKVVYGNMSGRVLDGQTGQALSGATVLPTDSPGSARATNASGAYELRDITAESHAFRAEMTGYISQSQSFTIPKESVLTEANFVLLPTAWVADKVVILLTWDAAPADLDSHLYVPNGDPYREVSFADLGEPTLTSDPFASLDLDDVDAFGPETTTVKMTGSTPYYPGTYRFFVHNYSAEETFANSGAKVEVYLDGVLTKTYRAPTLGSGVYWHVFDLTGSSFTEGGTVSDDIPLTP